ncbi:MAG: penicillin acylase family protein [Nitriliruptorales bacterium]|nr:penicillin acylase family protein [Nitriliruptorales bacterium]
MHRTAVVGVALGATAMIAGVAPASGLGDEIVARTILPPGNSLHFTLAGEAQGLVTGDPDDFGPNVDDQRELYWDYEFKDGALATEVCEDPQTPIDGVQLCFDEWGVPISWGEDTYTTWYGAGYGAAQIRLFLIDATRRTARGTLAEIAGPGSVAADVEARVLGYSEDELQAIVEARSEEAQTAVAGYIDGVNAWIQEVLTSRLDALPAEYEVLGAVPAPLTVPDVAAIGVLMTREVAAEGGTEMENVAALRALEAEFGTDEGRDIFQDFVWVEDAGASVSVPAEEGAFPRTTLDPAERGTVFEEMADFAATIPLELAEGPGTGDWPRPADGDIGDLDPSGDLLPGFEAFGALTAAEAAGMASASLEQWRQSLTGGSFLVVVAPHKTADNSALLISEPQLGYDPTLLMEAEVHGGGYHARGSTVAGIPVIGIGYTPDVAWALTTGNSKTIDSFIETTRPDSNGDGTPEYFHDGTWKEQECRDEVVAYRQAPEGVPVGPPTFSDTVTVCRTVHGPIVATTEDGTLARSVQYAMWDREVETVEGVLAWNRATNFEEFEAAMRQVTWNENTAYIGRDGHIAYWHPGLHLERPERGDLRLPMPGTGEYDLGDPLDFDDLPHAVDPAQGFLVNWNNKPAHGWGDGVGMSYSSYPAGRGHRVTNLINALSERDDWTFDRLRDLDRIAAETDMRATEFRHLILELLDEPDLTDREAAALAALEAWDGSANGDGAGMEFDRDTQYAADIPIQAVSDFPPPATVGPAASIFHVMMDELINELFDPYRTEAYDLPDRLDNSGRHVYDVNPALNFALRILDPSTSSLVPSRDYTDGRTAGEVLRAVLNRALDRLGVQDSEDVAGVREPYRMEVVCNPTGVVGPCGHMPFLERGTWIHFAGFGVSEAFAPAEPPQPEPTPSTGGGFVLVGVLLAAAGLGLRTAGPGRDRGSAGRAESRPIARPRHRGTTHG